MLQFPNYQHLQRLSWTSEEFDHKAGKAFIAGKFPIELEEIYEVISKVDPSKYKTKVSKEKTMPGQMLYSPIELNKAFKKGLNLLIGPPTSRTGLIFPSATERSGRGFIERQHEG